MLQILYQKYANANCCFCTFWKCKCKCNLLQLPYFKFCCQNLHGNANATTNELFHKTTMICLKQLLKNQQTTLAMETKNHLSTFAFAHRMQQNLKKCKCKCKSSNLHLHIFDTEFATYLYLSKHNMKCQNLITNIQSKV